ncbi:MAG: Xaa-Pro aminopeptidase [Psychrobacter sp.]|nr:Xaa-Pro aminopeptidase [Psychrobacter sp.]
MTSTSSVTSTIKAILSAASLVTFIAVGSGCATTMTGSSVPSISPTLTAAMPSIDRQGRIAYVEEQGQGTNKISTLYTIRPDGSERTLLTSVNGFIYGPTWSADGSKLAYSVQQTGNYPYIYVLDIASKTVVKAVDAAGINLSPSFSPDGSKLLYSSSAGGNADIYELTLSSGKTRQLTTLPSIEIQPSYSPDGASFVYVSDKSGSNKPQLYRYDFASGKTSRIATSGYATGPQMSMDGTKLGYLNGRQAAVMTLATGQVMNLGETGVDEPARLSPSGQYAVYPTRNSQGGSLVIRSLNGAASYTISSKSGALVRAPVWGR